MGIPMNYDKMIKGYGSISEASHTTGSHWGTCQEINVKEQVNESMQLMFDGVQHHKLLEITQ